MRRFKSLIALALALALIAGCAPKKEEAPASSQKTEQSVSSEEKKSEESKASESKSEQAKSEQAKSEESKASESAAAEGETISFTDSVGRTVQLPKNITRIAPSGGLAQQVLLTIAPHKLVALSRAVKGDMAVKIFGEYNTLPEVGQFFGKGDFNAETLASVKPQVIIDIGEPKKTMKEDMDSIQEKTGIPTIFVELKMENAGDAYRTLGKILGEEKKGDELGAYCDRVYKEIIEGMKNIPEDQRVKFALLLGDNGLNAIAKGSFQGEMLEQLGTNAVVVENPTAKGSGNEISAEQLAQWNPQVILFGPGSIYAQAKEDPFFSTLSAVADGKYYEVPSVPYNWIGMPPSVNRFLGMQWVAKIFYPQTFTYDLYERVAEYFKLFYHYDLKQDEFNQIMKNSLPKESK